MRTTAIGRQQLTRLLAAMICIAIGFSGYWVQSADSTASLFVFPRFLMYSDVSSGIAIFNPAMKAAQVTLTLNGADGTSIGTSVVVQIPARGQLARTASELFGQHEITDASLTVSSATPGLIAAYQTFDSGGTFLDGAEAPEASLNLIFPIAPSSEEGIAEVDLVNTNARNTAAELKLWSTEGELLGKATVQIPAGGAYGNVVSQIFPKGTSYAKASHITVDSKSVNLFASAQPMAGTSLFAGFTSKPSSGGYIDLAALNALPITRTYNAGVIPYFRTGSQYASTFSIANVENSSNDVTITAVSNNGSSLGTRKITLKPNGGFRSSVQGVFSSLGSGDQEGWLLVQAGGRVASAVIYGRSKGAALAAVSIQKAPKSDFIVPQVVQNTAYQTEITLVNPLSSTGYADIYVVNPSGVATGLNQLVLPPSSRVSQTLDQILPEVLSQSGGYIYIHPSQAVFGLISIWKQTGELVSAFAPQELTVSFYPAPPTTFSVTGKVLLNNQPAVGFKVILTGPVNASTVVAADGSYVFSGLPAGRYSVAVDEPSFQFLPAQATFELSTLSKRQNFEAFLGTSEIALKPASAAVRSSDTTIRIYGRDLNNTAQAYVGVVRLKTTFVDSSQLDVVIPSFLLATPDQLELYVVLNDGSPARRVSKTASFYVFQNKPALTGVRTNGLLLEGRGPAAISLYGSGFLPGAIVKINGSSENIEILSLDDAQIVVNVPASYFKKSGDYPVIVVNPYPANAESNIQLLTVLEVNSSTSYIRPLAVHVKSADTTLELYGQGFNDTAQAYIGDIKLKTTYVDSSMAQAIIPAFLLVKPAKLDILLITNENSINRRISGPYVFYVYQDQPVLTSVKTTGAMLEGRGAAVITLVGSGFLPGVVVKVNGSSDQIEILSRDDVKIVATLAASYFAKAGVFPVTVVNPYPANVESNILLLTVLQASGNSPFIQPTGALVNSPDITIELYGRDFASSSQAYAGDVRLTTTFVDPYVIQALIPAYMLAKPAKYSIDVSTSADGAPPRISGPYIFYAYQDRPVLTNLTTNGSMVEGRGSATITLLGSGFLPGATVKINGSGDDLVTQAVDDARIEVVVPASYFENGGIFPASITNPYPANAESNILLLTVFHPAPVIEDIIPNSMTVRLEAGANSADLEVLGYGFRKGAAVYFNGTALPTGYCSWDPFCLTVHLYAKIPVSLLRKAGFGQIVVKNPDPSLAASEVAFLRVEGLQPTISFVVPGSAGVVETPFAYTLPVIVNGTNFGPETSVRVWKDCCQEPGEFVAPQGVLSSTQLYINMLVDSSSIGDWKVQLANPSPGGGLSKPFTFAISKDNFDPNPFLISLNPEFVAAGGPAFTLTINGSNFKPGAQIQFNSLFMTATVVSSKQVTVKIAASLIQSPGKIPITVVNPDNGGSSNRLFLEIR